MSSNIFLKIRQVFQKRSSELPQHDEYEPVIATLTTTSDDQSKQDHSQAECSSHQHHHNRNNQQQHQHQQHQKYGFRSILLTLLLMLSSGFIGIWIGSYMSETSLRNFTGAGYTNDYDDGAAATTVTLESLKSTALVENLEHGAVASDQGVCSEIGTAILRDKGGNAVDAAVATALCLGVANPASSGLGGGAFMLVHTDQRHFQSKQQDGNEDHAGFIDARDEGPGAQFQDNKMTEIIDCRETAPAASSTNMYADLPVDASSFGGLAVAVPGELHCLELAHKRHGKLDWKVVVEPAIHLARNGVRITPHLAKDIRGIVDKMQKRNMTFPQLVNFVSAKDTSPKNRPGQYSQYLQEDDLLVNVKLADTLQLIADQGSGALYKGELAKQLVDDIQNAGGIMTANDLASYQPTLRSPVSGIVNGFRIVSVPPPSSGGATIIGAARFLSGYASPLSSATYDLSVHRMVEAFRHAFAMRMSISDPAFDANHVTKHVVADLVDTDYMEQLRQQTLDNDTLPISAYGGQKWAQLNDGVGKNDANDAHEGDRKLARRFGYLEDTGTSHFSIVDGDGNSVSMTTSVNQIFGSYVFSETTGCLMGNTMDDFGTPGRSNYYGLKPSESNFISPGKKPLSSMSPTLVFRLNEDQTAEQQYKSGRLVFVVGGSGGPKIITSTLQVLSNYCFLGMTLFESMTRPRIHEQLLYHDAFVTTTELDVLAQGPTIRIPNRTKAALLNRGHDRLLDIDYAGTVQAVAIDLETGMLSAVSDVRKGGCPIGY